jgi:hypothetical protein
MDFAPEPSPRFEAGGQRLTALGANRRFGFISAVPVVERCFTAGLGVFIRPSVQTPVASGFLAIFASVQIVFWTLAKSVTCARFIGIWTLGRLRTPKLGRSIVLVGAGAGQIAAKGILKSRPPIPLRWSSPVSDVCTVSEMTSNGLSSFAS